MPPLYVEEHCELPRSWLRKPPVSYETNVSRLRDASRARAGLVARGWWAPVLVRRGRRRKVMLSRAEPERQTAPTAPRASHVSATPAMRAASSGPPVSSLGVRLGTYCASTRRNGGGLPAQLARGKSGGGMWEIWEFVDHKKNPYV